MRKRPPQRDPIVAYQRKATAARRVGGHTQCACGETRPEALIARSNPTICAACDRKRRGKTTFDDHHVAGKANNPVTIPVWVNDHRACLSVAQDDWSKETRENPDGSPLLAAAAHIRGFMDTGIYLLEKLFWIVEMLEMAHAIFVKKLGPKWWLKTELRQFKPKR
jgi:hypothetical protein